MRSLMMGRFQPFHLGHLDLVRQILKESDELIIAVTSSQFNYLEKDPFTAGERIEMIHNSIKEAGFDLSKIFIVAIENQFNIATWASYLKSALPHFDSVYSGNEYVQMLLSDSLVHVISPKLLDRSKFNATSIRNKIANEEVWEPLVPPAVVAIIKNINGEKRIQTIYRTDTKPTEH